MLENGKIIYVGPTGLYELRYTKQKVPIKGHILFECDPGFSLIDGPPGKTCQNGTWEPSGLPKCVFKNVLTNIGTKQSLQRCN